MSALKYLFFFQIFLLAFFWYSFEEEEGGAEFTDFREERVEKEVSAPPQLAESSEIAQSETEMVKNVTALKVPPKTMVKKFKKPQFAHSLNLAIEKKHLDDSLPPFDEVMKNYDRELSEDALAFLQKERERTHYQTRGEKLHHIISEEEAGVVEVRTTHDDEKAPNLATGQRVQSQRAPPLNTSMDISPLVKKRKESHDEGEFWSDSVVFQKVRPYTFQQRKRLREAKRVTAINRKVRALMEDAENGTENRGKPTIGDIEINTY